MQDQSWGWEWKVRLSQGIQTQQPIKDLSPSRPAFCHLEIHTISIDTPREESHDGILSVSGCVCVCVCLSPTNTIILSWFLLLPHRLINHSWEQRGVSIDKTNTALGEKTLPVDILSHLIHPSFKFHTKLNLCHCLTRLYHPQLKQTCVTTVFFFPSTD